MFGDSKIITGIYPEGSKRPETPNPPVEEACQSAEESFGCVARVECGE